VYICPRCRAQVPALLQPHRDVTLCAPCWDLILMIAAGDADDVDAR
jgi:DNA-directed RNA polymerase subunit RPC12/RpoP